MTDSADVVIIGGGLIGCACAYYLAAEGLSVTLCERGDLGEGASGACEGILSLQSKASVRTLRAAREALDLYETLPAELDADLELRREGGLVVCETEGELAQAGSRAEALAAEGVSVELLAPAEARRLAPALAESIAGASFCPVEAHVNPWKLLLAYAEAAERAGARLSPHTSVKGMRCRGGRAMGAETSQGRIACAAVVNAAGARAPQVAAWAGLELDIRPQRGQVLVTEKAPRLLGPFVLSAGYAAGKRVQHAEETAELAAAQLAAGNVLVGSTRESVGHRLDITAAGLTAIGEEARRLLPGLGPLAVIRGFAGLRPHGPGAEPIVAAAQDPANFVTAAGHGGDGVALAPWTGRQVRRLVLETAMFKQEPPPAENKGEK